MKIAWSKLRCLPTCTTRQTVATISALNTNSTSPYTQLCRRKTMANNQLDSSPFGQSMILLQDGVSFQELPIIVRRSNQEMVAQKNFYETCYTGEKTECEKDSSFTNCSSIDEILAQLGRFQAGDVSAKIAFEAIKRIGEVGQKSYPFETTLNHTTIASNESNNSFMLEAVLAQLVHKVCVSGKSEAVIKTLEILANPLCLESTCEVQNLQKKMVQHTLHQILDGCCSVLQVCSAIQVFSNLSKNNICCSSLADKAWVGLLHSAEGISETNIIQVFQILPLLKHSQRLVLQVLERELSSCIWKLQKNDIMTILNLMVKTKYLSSERICNRISYWLGFALHSFTSESLNQLLQLFIQLNHFDQQTGRHLERFVRARGANLSSPELITAIATYCYKTRFRSPTILSVLSTFFINHSSTLDVLVVHSLLTTFGLFNYEPNNDHQFWTAVEQVLDHRLNQYPVEMLLDVVLSCIYLRRYPINFVPRIFSSTFLKRLHIQPPTAVEASRTKINLFDIAMSLECSQYHSKILPKDHSAKSLARDGRLTRSAKLLIPHIEKVVGPKFQVNCGVILCNLPLHEIYIADLLISPASESALYRYGHQRSCHGTVVILIHPPEHYSHDREQLVGLQVMRRRHLAKMGFRVVDFSLDHLQKAIRHVDVVEEILSSELEDHIEECKRLIGNKLL